PGEEAIKNFKKGDMVRASVQDIDVEKERISLSIKHALNDPMESLGDIKKGDVVTATVLEVSDAGIEVSVGQDGLKAFIRRAELSRDKSEQRPEKYSVGDKVDARVTNLDKTSRKIMLSIKAREIAEEKEAVAQYGSSDAGASLGDILGAALKRNQDKK
ncbi:MAG TPA: 30S ribosomal protein S1, partial [Alphaproteobacteria bacterium]|nr:30S ribosomal protein S1 [Alphaproteobacteria bacterium]